MPYGSIIPVNSELFLLGAGFNLDANSYLTSGDSFSVPSTNVCHNPSLPWERELLPCSYPLVRDLVRACFGPGSDLTATAEQLFSKAYQQSEWIPLNRLVDILQCADHYLAAKIACRTDTPYVKFFNEFREARFLSYNYDCLAELHLQTQGRWRPEQGFGLEAEVYRNSTAQARAQIPLENESSIVLHLHGSLYLYPIESDLSKPDTSGTRWLTLCERVRFLFDPDSLSCDFPDFARPELGHGYTLPVARFIPPIDDKNLDLEETYYRLVAERATGFIHEASSLISLGYSFAESDAPSYDALLRQLFAESKSLVVINPSAELIVLELKARYRSYAPSIISLPVTFAHWVAAGFPRGTI